MALHDVREMKVRGPKAGCRGWTAGAVALLMLAAAAAPSSAQSLRVADAAPPLGGDLAGKFSLFQPPSPAPPIPFYDTRGKAVRFGDLAGRVLLVNFWATWCAPCIREMPTLDRLEAELGGGDFAVVALSQDFDGLKSVPPFLSEHGLDHLEAFVDKRGKIADELGIKVLPTTLLIDRDGQIVGGLEGPTDWDTPAVKDLIRYYLDAITSADAR
jgi:thiol-disulfide isomerase/thioredoxin